MNKLTKYVLVLVVSVILMPGSLWAEMVRGQVTAINKENQSITILPQDASGNIQESKELKVDPNAQFAGIQSLDDLEVGDEIVAEVDRRMFGREQVKQLTKSIAAGTAAENLEQEANRLTSSLPASVSLPEVPSSVTSSDSNIAREQSAGAELPPASAGAYTPNTADAWSGSGAVESSADAVDEGSGVRNQQTY